MIELYACKPGPSGHTVHLQSPDYRPGKKSRSICDSASLCGVLVTGDREPLPEALKWPSPAPATLLAPAREWAWCKPCVGHAAAMAGLCRQVLESVVGVSREEAP